MKRIWIAVCVCALGIGTAFTTIENDRLFEISKNIEIFVNVFKEINAHYVDDVDPGSLMRTGIDAMLGSLDPYTNFISESQVENYRINVDGKFNGLGATLGNVDDKVAIIETTKNSPINRYGLQIGDFITHVNGLATEGKNAEEVNSILRGITGTEMNLRIQRPYPNKSFDVQVPRSNVNKQNVPYSGFVSDEVGYINLTTFTAGAGKNVEIALKELKKENPSIKGVILDLRNNGGGLLREAVNLCNIFVPKETEIVSTRGKVKERDVQYKTMNNPVDLDIPIVVLVNKKSASASEIVSGVIQDLDRGVVMGQRSYGKGLVQNQKEVGYNSRVKVTTSKYYIPSGRCIQSVEYKNGEPVDIPDENRSAFKTKNGRKVLDGGGVTPDVKLEEPSLDPIIAALNKKNIIFKFVNKYVSGQTDTMALEDISFDSFTDFTNFANTESFSFDLELESLLDKMNDVALEENYLLGANKEYTALQSKFSQLKEKALTDNKEVILAEIEKEIASRYYYDKGKVYASLDRDQEIAEAISLLLNTEKYQSLLK